MTQMATKSDPSFKVPNIDENEIVIFEADDVYDDEDDDEVEFELDLVTAELNYKFGLDVKEIKDVILGASAATVKD